MTRTIEDEIVEEIRREREAHAQSLDFDLKRITEDLQRQEHESGVQVVRRPSRRPVAMPKEYLAEQ